MDSSTTTLDPLNDTSSFATEISFDDMLDTSPVKRDASTLDDPLDLENERKAPVDDTLNTPQPKKSRPNAAHNSNLNAPATMVTKSAAVPTPNTATTTLVKQTPTMIKATTATATPSTTAVKVGTSATGGTTTSAPVLLNNRFMMQERVLKITQKPFIQKTTTTTTTSGGMTAVRLQSVSGATTTTTAAGVGNTATATVGNKTVAIQVIRPNAGAGTTTGATTKNTLTLSPNMAQQLSGKRIITASGSQVVLRPVVTGSTAARPSVTVTATVTATATGTTTNSAIIKTAGAPSLTTTTAAAAPKAISSADMKRLVAGAATVSMPSSGTTKTVAGNVLAKTAGKIVVQSANGKQIVVSNPLIKLSPKPGSVMKVATPGSGGSTNVSGAGTAIQLAGKQVQYVRVMPTTKSNSGSNVSSSVSSTTPTTIKLVSGTGFTMVRSTMTTAGKTLLTQSPRKDGGGTPLTFSPVTSKVKTIVTVPSVRTLTDSQKSPSSTSSNNGSSANTPTSLRSTATSASTSSLSTVSSLAGKHKISEINSELHRLTGVNNGNNDKTDESDSGPTEAKRLVSGKRIVVVQRTMMRPNATGQLQQITLQGGNKLTNNQAVNNHSLSALGGGNQLANASPKKQLFSVLKSNNPPVQSSNGNANANAQVNVSGSTSQLPERKSLLISGKAQALMAQQQQQHKSMPLKRPQPAGASQQQPPPKLPTLANSGKTSASNSKFSAVKVKDEPLDNDIKPLLEDAGGAVRRKHCNCSKSQCLKLYCDCFANGEFCQDCTCKDCFNNLQYEDERQRAIRICLDRNPSAFKPKITTGDLGDMRLHNKGCNCKRSGCLKNYCECYEAKIPCSSNCKCLGCRNVEERPDLDMDPIDPKVLATLVNSSLSGAGQKRTYERANSKAGCSSDKLMYKDAAKALVMGGDLLTAGGMGMGGASNTGSNGGPSAEKQQCNFITQDVVDATIQCMISQAVECEDNGLPAYQTEKMVMEEMGRCLVEIIDFSIRNTDSSFSQE